jgi:putative membrane protein
MKSLALAAVTLLAFVGCASDSTPVEPDADFALSAASIGTLEGQLAASAMDHAVREDVRSFAYGMIDDHRRAYRGLEKAAEEARIRLPQGMIPEHADMYIRLTSLRGVEFDRAYLQATIEAQEQAIAAFNVEAARSRSDIAHWASEMLPTLEKHLARAKELAAQQATVAAVSPSR